MSSKLIFIQVNATQLKPTLESSTKIDLTVLYLLIHKAPMQNAWVY